MPTVETSYSFLLVFLRHASLMESRVRRMFQFRFCEPLVVVDGAVADELHLRDAGDGLQVGVKNGFLRFASLVVSVTV